MNVNRKPGKQSMFGIGFALVVVSYVLLAPVALFAALGVGGKSWLWAKLAGATYILSWVLFIAGFLLAGREAVRAGREWFARIFKHKKESPAAQAIDDEPPAQLQPQPPPPTPRPPLEASRVK